MPLGSRYANRTFSILVIGITPKSRVKFFMSYFEYLYRLLVSLFEGVSRGVQHRMISVVIYFVFLRLLLFALLLLYVT